jgi:hypothetical protein
LNPIRNVNFGSGSESATLEKRVENVMQEVIKSVSRRKVLAKLGTRKGKIVRVKKQKTEKD